MKKRIIDSLCRMFGLIPHSGISEANEHLRGELMELYQVQTRYREALELIAQRNHRGVSRVEVARDALK